MSLASFTLAVGSRLNARNCLLATGDRWLFAMPIAVISEPHECGHYKLRTASAQADPTHKLPEHST